eukprot:m.63060 g.63060  ORF g.63060 m.63060 type:complete len:394 (+) comp11557_c0_seq4:235-1416(+)
MIEQFTCLLAVIFAVLFLCAVVPAPGGTTVGYVCDSITGEPLKYKLNSFRMTCIVFFIMVFLHWEKYFDITYFAANFYTMSVCSCVVGLLVSFALFLRGKCFLKPEEIDRGVCCLTVSGKRSMAAESTKEFDARGPIEHFYCGYEWNPRFFGIDLKMFNYSIGAILLLINLISCAALHIAENNGYISMAFTVYLICATWFIFEYCYFERVHLYTYDLFRERAGFKMVWGCWCFYPYFYSLGGKILADFTYENGPKHDLTLSFSLFIILLFFNGWSLTRGANLQKFSLKTGQTHFLGQAHETIPGTEKRVLCNMWWGIARHINYTGEIIQAIAFALPVWIVTGNILSWLYPLYYVVLFIPRQLDDDKICKAKYGDKAWQEYCRRVPYRMLPFVW